MDAFVDDFEYDKDLYISMSKSKKSNFVKSIINEIVKKIHNPALVDINLAPNENIIYHLYSDGTITRQKGSWAYGKRNIFEIESYCVKPNTFFTFPNKGENEGDTYSIMTLENCKKVKNLMNELLLKF